MPPTFIYTCLWLHWIGRLLDKFKLLDNDVKADVVLCFSKKCTLQHLINQNKIAEVSNPLYCISTVSLRMFTHVHLPKIWFCLERRSVFGQMHTRSLLAHKNPLITKVYWNIPDYSWVCHVKSTTLNSNPDIRFIAGWGNVCKNCLAWIISSIPSLIND